ncbi:carbohydrate kinase family protein [Camelliibacillus cellulosilyticus]|uniref:Carbohydrate kinase family protein n=1 Tax=Camelliibacillus cellulosilyticus TaxID=2174486 RepID=A0ABV9GKN2_9BACL
MVHQNKIVTVGEAFLQFTPVEATDSLKDAECFRREPGGSPINVAACAALLDAETRFIGKLGQDPFGDYLMELLKSTGIDTSIVSRTKQAKTGVYFTDAHSPDYDQTVSADFQLRPDDITEQALDRGDILYISSKPLIQTPSRGAIEKALTIGGEKGCLIAFAPQLVQEGWPNAMFARETILHSMPYAHLLILGEQELAFLSEKEDEYQAIHSLYGGKNKLLIILRGHKGLTYVTDREKGIIRFQPETIIDPKGMNDAFIGYLLADLLLNGVTVENLSAYFSDPFIFEPILEQALFCRAASGKRRGSFKSMVTREQLKRESVGKGF